MKRARNQSEPGVLLISIDTEMAWGSVHHQAAGSYSYANSEGFTEREVIRRLIGLFERCGRRPPRFPHLGPWARRVLGIVDTISPLPGSAVYPRHEHGLWNLPANFYHPADPRWRWLPFGPAIEVAQAKRRLRQAAGTGSLFHLWFHSHNLTPDPRRGLMGLEALLAEAARLRERGMLRSLTMAELALEQQSLA